MPRLADGDEMAIRRLPGIVAMLGRRALRISVSGLRLSSSEYQKAFSSRIAHATVRPRRRRKDATWTRIVTRLRSRMLSLPLPRFSTRPASIGTLSKKPAM